MSPCLADRRPELRIRISCLQAVLIVVACMFAMPSAQADPSPLAGEWERWITPDARYAHAAAFDDVGRRMYIFGGRDTPVGAISDLWQLDVAAGPLWTRLDTSGPPPLARTGHNLIYDSIGNRLLLVGGTDDRGRSNREIWILQLGVTPLSWTYEFASGKPPESLSQAVAVFDAPRNRVVFYGGVEDHRITRSVWTLELGPLRWTKLAPDGPSPGARYKHCGALDAGGERMLVFGGHDSLGTKLADVWALSLSESPTWSQVTPVNSGPQPRLDAVAAFDPAAQALVMFGGDNYEGYHFSDVWILSLSGAPNWVEVSYTPPWPPPLAMHTATFDSASRSMLVFGGFTNPIGPTNDELWRFSTESLHWTRPALPVDGPIARRNACFVVDDTGGRALLFGGYATSGYLGDLWSVSLADPDGWLPMTPLGPTPSARTQAAATVDPSRHRLLVHGGYASSFPYYRDLWALDLGPGGGWTSSLPGGGPPGVLGHTLVYDSNRDRLLMFGGYDGYTVGPLNTVWSLDLSNPAAWDSIPVTGPRPRGRYGHSAIFDAARDQMVVHGGDGPEAIGGETWAFDCVNATWSELAAGGPSMLQLSARAMTLDAARNRLCLLGWRDTGHFYTGVWTLDLLNPGAWVLLEPSGVPPIVNTLGSVAFDAAGDRFLAVMGPQDRQREALYALQFQTNLLATEPTANMPGAPVLRINPSRVAGEALVSFAAGGLRRVQIFDLAGRQVAEIEPDDVGRASADWDLLAFDGHRVAPGIYFAVATAATGRARGKLVVLQ